MNPHDTDIVSTLRLAVAEEIGQDRYELWFGLGTELVLEDGRVCVEVSHQFALDWLRNNFRRQIERAVRNVIGSQAMLEFRVNPDRKPLVVHTETEGSATVLADRQPKASTRCRSDADVRSAHGGPGPVTRSVEKSGRRYERLETFVVGDCNRVAHASAELLTRQLGGVSPLFVYGPTGVGKSHVLEGMYRALVESSRRCRCVYLTAEQFTSYFLEALQGKGLPSFRRRYRDVDLLVIEDVQFLLGKRATQAELQHTIDTLSRNGRQLAFSADRPPAQLSDLGPELVTRFSGGLVCSMQPPETATRLAILQSWSTSIGRSMPLDVLQFVARQIGGDIRQLRGALNRLVATGDACQRDITLELATETLKDMIHTSRQLFRLEEVERAVCEMFDVDQASLKSNRRSKSITQPRMLAMWLARKYTRAALSEIGDYFGRKSHATVVSAQKTVERWLKDGQSLQLPAHHRSIDETIRQLEARLRAS